MVHLNNKHFKAILKNLSAIVADTSPGTRHTISTEQPV